MISREIYSSIEFAFREPQKRENPVIATGFQFGGIRLKDRSAGGWRSGMQRSEK